MPLEHAGEHQVPHASVREDRDLDELHRTGRRVHAVVGQPGAAVVVDHHVELLADGPQRLVGVVPQRLDVGMVGRDPRQQHAALEATLVLCPTNLGDGVVDIVQQDLDDAATTSPVLLAELGQPPIVRLEAGPPTCVVGRGRHRRQQAGGGEERRNRVREQDLGRDAVGVELAGATLVTPVAIGVGAHEVAPRVHVGIGPGVELGVPTSGQVRPVVTQVGARVAIGRHDHIPIHHGLPTSVVAQCNTVPI